jgi:hypothetical protein
MKLLVYGNRKQDDMIWDVSTPEKRAAAFLALFAVLKDDWQVYEASTLNTKESALFVQASEGDAESAEALLNRRKTYEYEEWHFAETEN